MDGVFRATNYPPEILEARVDDLDFAVAIAHADDLTANRGKNLPGSLDNVIFELGRFLWGDSGEVGQSSWSRDWKQVKFPSDFAGVTTITYRFENGVDVATQLAPACNQLREHISALGPSNG